MPTRVAFRQGRLTLLKDFQVSPFSSHTRFLISMENCSLTT